MIRIITDSASDLEQNSFNNLTIVPLKVVIGDQTYRDGVDMTKNEFFQKLETSDILPSTSLATPFEFAEIYQQIQDNNDEAIVLPLSSELSGTCQSAVIAAADFDNISVVDTRGVSFGQTLLVMHALQMVEKGFTRQQIVDSIEEEKNKIRFVAVVDTLKYLEKGGRLSKGAALVGGLIGIKPILEIEDGALVAKGKSRGTKNAYRKIAEIVKNDDINLERPVILAYSGTTDTKLQFFIKDNEEVLNPLKENMQIRQLGSAVGTHAGPGTVVITYFMK